MDKTAHRISQVRALTELTQEAFGRALGVTRGAVGNWERGKGIKTENLKAIAQTFSVSFEWLATGEGREPTEVILADTALARDRRADYAEISERISNMSGERVKALLNLIRAFDD